MKTNTRIQTLIEVRPGFWVAGNSYRSLSEAMLALNGICNWCIAAK
jgi:hypothetical protein